MRTLLRPLIRSALTLAMVVLVVLVTTPPADANDPDPPGPVPEIPLPDLPDVPLPSLPGAPSIPAPSLADCTEAPVPVSPGQGIPGFFDTEPEQLPPTEDPFEPGATTTIYEQYGYAGLRYHTYDLGCGPDAVRSPDAVIGTAVANWIMQVPIAFAALTGSVTQVAFDPTFLDAFDPVVERVSTALHESLFASWIPAVLAMLGLLIIFKARRSALASTTAAVGWALFIVILAVAIFRWPTEAGHAADETVTGTLGTVVGQLDGEDSDNDPGVAVSSNVQEAILYRAWLAGTLGDPDSETARKYGPELFRAQALTWREAEEAQEDPERAEELIEGKQQDWEEIAEQIKEEDPEAYENLTGNRSETRVGYAILTALATLLALPFLLLSSLLMLGCFLIVRLAVMLFPAFAVLGAFPSTRGLVTGIGRTVAAAVVNAILFGIGAGVTVAVLGILFHPGGGAPAWLSLILMPLFSFIMWQALKPFRRLTTMVNPDTDPFRGVSDPYRRTKSEAWRLTKVAAASAVGGGAGAAAVEVLGDDKPKAPPERAEARPGSPSPAPTSPRPPMPLALRAAHAPDPVQPTPQPSPEPPDSPPLRAGSSAAYEAKHRREAAQLDASPATQVPRALPVGRVPRPAAEPPPPAPVEPEWYDGEEVYPIYRPPTGNADDAA